MTLNQGKYADLIKVLKQINVNLERITVQLEQLSESLPPGREKSDLLEALDVMTLLSLPDHLRKTAMILVKLGKATASQIAKESGRARAVESAYLNQLVAMGHIKKGRQGRRVYFWFPAAPQGRAVPGRALQSRNHRGFPASLPAGCARFLTDYRDT